MRATLAEKCGKNDKNDRVARDWGQLCQKMTIFFNLIFSAESPVSATLPKNTGKKHFNHIFCQELRATLPKNGDWGRAMPKIGEQSFKPHFLAESPVTEGDSAIKYGQHHPIFWQSRP